MLLGNILCSDKATEQHLSFVSFRYVQEDYTHHCCVISNIYVN